MLKNTHPSQIDPSTVSDECLHVRLAKCAQSLQQHVCNDACLVRKLNMRQMKELNFDPSKQTLEDIPETIRSLIVKCKKNFPKVVPEGVGELQAHVLQGYNKIISYAPPRDNPYINNYHPVFLHFWGANIDLQILHGKGMCMLQTVLVHFNRTVFRSRCVRHELHQQDRQVR